MGNANSGRRPQPTQMKVLRGNPGKRKPNENEVRPPAGTVTKPATLSAGGSAIWDELAPVCLAMGTLTTADVRPFATMCELQSTMQETSAAKDGRQLFKLQTDEQGEGAATVVIDGILRLERETATALRPYYALFGLEPTSRARISVPKVDDAPESKWAGVLK